MKNTYTYYAVSRPPAPGTVPPNKEFEQESYFQRTYQKDIGRDAWGILRFSEPLTAKEVTEYELIPDPETRMKIPLECRLSGEDLENSKELLRTLDENFGVKANEYGCLTLFCGTDSTENIQKEHDIFLFSKPDGEVVKQGSEILAFCIPVELLEPDDVYSDEVRFQYLCNELTKDFLQNVYHNEIRKDDLKMQNVLWFSRHEMTPEQKEALGPDVTINQVDKTIKSAYELQEEIDKADVVAIVAPINLQQQFLKLAGDKPVIMAVNDRVLVPQPDGSESKVEFQFKKWERLLDIQIKKEDYVPEKEVSLENDSVFDKLMAEAVADCPSQENSSPDKELEI